MTRRLLWLNEMTSGEIYGWRREGRDQFTQDLIDHSKEFRLYFKTKRKTLSDMVRFVF
jgi:hypothetical protein